MKLPRQLILLVLAALMPLVALSAVLGAAALRQGQHAMEADARDRVSDLTISVSRELTAQVEILQAIASSPILDGKVDDAQFRDMAARLLRGQPLWVALTLTARDGTRLVDQPALPPTVSRHVVDDVSQQQAVQSGRPVIGRILVGPQGGAAFAIFVPVIRSGRVIEVLGAVVRPDAIRRLLLADALPRGWRAGVIDQAGRVVTRSIKTPDLTGQAANPETLKLRAQAPEGVYQAMGVDGVGLVTAYKVLPVSGWSIHVAMPRTLYEKPLIRAVWLVGSGGVVSLLLVALFLWLLTREIRLRQDQQAALEEGLRLEALGRMTGGVAHDFNNLLMIVQGSAELLKRRVAGQERLENGADAILTAVQRGQTITRQLLAFGRRGTHEPVGFRMQDRTADLLPLLLRSVSEKTATSLKVPADTWPIYADPRALEVALINLAVNASDAMPEGGELIISAANAPPQKGRDGRAGLTGDYVAISVTDTGSGIDPDQLGHIFEPFFTTKPAGKGTGLGLSQVYGFARQSNGAVTVRSKLGEGTTFTLYLPRATAVAATPAPAEPLVGSGQGERCRALLVEDNKAVAEVVHQMLRTAGCEVVWVANADDALKQLAQPAGVDVILSDIVIEGAMSGLDLAQSVRARSPDLPVVLMTGYSEALARGSASGFTVLAKPFTQDEVAAAIRRARAGRDPAERAAAVISNS